MEMTETAEVSHRTGSRFWLLAPPVLLVLVAAAWSAAWFVVRARASDAIDAWLVREANAGRNWTCADRSLGGYPFRVEISCSSLRLQHGAVSASLGRVEAVAQVYQPRHVIAEIEGPLQWSDGQVTAEATWGLLEASVRHGPSGFQRVSLVAEAPAVRIAGLGPADISLAGQELEAHLRPNPTRPAAEGAYDVAISTRQARIPAVEAWLGNPDPVDLQADTTITQAQDVRARPLIEEFERWREAGGQVDMALLSLVQGARRLEVKGDLRLDELHRPTGRLDVAGAGLDGLLAPLSGGRAAAGEALLGALLGSRRETPSRPSDNPRLPSVRLEGGRVFLGVFPIPGARLQPLY
jgi:hypothetical protein